MRTCHRRRATAAAATIDYAACGRPSDEGLSLWKIADHKKDF
jgi:hypothetical protein